ncbi:MAG TPA: type VII secretion target [Actinophytocola sp.]|uniref:type VII secretion target n=1 Tax=Actinophytocola sp. TaxID=1872138 RepID=UPI002DDD3674|nr:type VII secretion target [Actinophytocola sp.]HEV2782192.1 type VII secretion target [Actinophytocola sp.]
MDGYEVLTGELDAHAGKVDSYTERLRTAADAARQVTMNDSAYGVVCQPFAMLLQPFEELGVRTLRQGVDALADTARKVRDTARSYTTTDTAEAGQYRGIAEQL